MPRAVIVSNGSVSDYSLYKDKIKTDDYVICADGGIKHLLALGITPDLWIGDFDSCKFSELIDKYHYLADVETVTLKTDKNETDTHFACMTALDMGCTDIVLMFAGGGRLDHMLSNIHLLEYIHDRGASGKIIDEKNTVTLCSDFISVTKERKYLSIIPLDKEVVISKTAGLKYPLTDFTLPRQISMGVSNEIVAPKGEITIKLGSALIVESDD